MQKQKLCEVTKAYRGTSNGVVSSELQGDYPGGRLAIGEGQCNRTEQDRAADCGEAVTPIESLGLQPDQGG